MLASHIPDGIAFRKAMVAASIKVGALIGSTMAAVRPRLRGRPRSRCRRRLRLRPARRPASSPRRSIRQARATYDRFAAAWRRSGRRDVGGDAVRPPDQARKAAMRTARRPRRQLCAILDHRARRRRHRQRPPRKRLSGFSAAWALVHDVLPSAADRRPPRRREYRPGRAGARSADRQPAQRRRPPLLVGAGHAWPERASRRGHLAVAGRPHVCVRLAARVRHGVDRGRAAAMSLDRHRARGVGGSSSARPDHGAGRCGRCPLGSHRRPRPRTASLVGAVFGILLLLVALAGGAPTRSSRGAGGILVGVAGGTVLVMIAIQIGPYRRRIPKPRRGRPLAVGRHHRSSWPRPRRRSCVARCSTS